MTFAIHFSSPLKKDATLLLCDLFELLGVVVKNLLKSSNEVDLFSARL